MEPLNLVLFEWPLQGPWHVTLVGSCQFQILFAAVDNSRFKVHLSIAHEGEDRVLELAGNEDTDVVRRR